MVCLATPKTCGMEGQPCCYNSDPASEPLGLFLCCADLVQLLAPLVSNELSTMLQ
jgi:hypothetical protein